MHFRVKQQAVRDVLRDGKAGDLGLCPHSCCIYISLSDLEIGLEDVLSTLFMVYAQKQGPIVLFGFLHAAAERTQASPI